MTSQEIRKAFLSFFESKNHKIVPSASMVVKNDPTLMFTNAGMNQFKDIFLGNAPVKYSRIADTQKCLRVSGKHNDLEEVGHDTYHHTMFEMLGNWSFGDYFKKEAINWGWEFLVEKTGIDPNRLYATIFEGDKTDGVDRDTEAYDLWKQYLPEERILNGNKKDNFWEMGESGPCGPCSEVHVDIRSDEERAKTPGHELVNRDHPHVIEIWNLVFIQYNRKASGALESLPAKHVDTGMGFERLCMVLQGKQSNYDTDVFQTTIAEIGKLSGKKYGQNEKQDIAMRVIADHLRAIVFAISDGQLPSNNKAGYVIRRILRRAVRYGYTFLEFREAFIFKLVAVLKDQMGTQFKELVSQEGLISKVIKEEEESFLRTLETGLKLLDVIIEKTKSNNQTEVNGKDAFTLYDTYGFPLDLTELILKENGLKANLEQFNSEMEQQKNRSRKASSHQSGDWEVLANADKEEFVGYKNLVAQVRITRYRKVKTQKKELFHLVFDNTPFYAEAGGQVGDKGYIEANGEKISIIDTQKENNLIIHITDKLPADPAAEFKAVVPEKARRLTANNHTATHLLDFALRKVLGVHVEQKGSLVTPNYLRFDFSHFQKVSEEELLQIQRMVNAMIRENKNAEVFENIPMDEAREMGAIALFGEKYGDSVRVMKFGDSIELCGGTHVEATGQIGMFHITSESAISAGVRRIEAITGERVEELLVENTSMIKQMKQLLNNPKNLAVSVRDVLDNNRELQKQLETFAKKEAQDIKGELKDAIETVNGINVLTAMIPITDAQLIKDLAFQLKGEIENLFLVLGAEVNGKANLSIMISDRLVKEKDLNAGQIIREAAKAIQGGGGGQAFYATAGGRNIGGMKEAFEIAKKHIG
ncbi:MAG: alanine--tRNA ligase [Prolixibacteraceae bacterium]|jgi:alanyl-tRNA synthetase|nr:alanine--tRNA ligase [Prolixibacteraceae bacterium]